jgi:hypothetical protein
MTNNHVYLNDENIIVKNAQEIIDNILTVEYPHGFRIVENTLDGTLDRRGMLAVAQMRSITEENKDDSYYFAFDYDKDKWFLIQKISGLGNGGGLNLKIDGEEAEFEDSYANITENSGYNSSIIEPAP